MQIMEVAEDLVMETHDALSMFSILAGEADVRRRRISMLLCLKVGDNGSDDAG